MTTVKSHSSQSAPFRHLLGAAFLGAALLVSSCREKPVADHDQLSIQLLTQAFDAVHESEHELAAARLTKIQADERAFINKLITREKEGAVLKTISDQLHKGDYDAAAKTVEKGLVECGHTPQMTHARRVVEGLRYMKAYKQKVPFKDPAEADSSVNGLPQPKLFGNHIGYVKWLNQQKKDRDALLQKVRREKAAGLMVDLDRLILQERGNYGIVLKKLNTVIPNHPLYKSVAAGEPEKNLSQEELELYRMIRFKQAPSLEWSLPGNHSAKTLSGQYLSVLGFIKENKRLAALAGFREVIEEEPSLDPVLIGRFMVYARVKAASISPSLTSVLDAIYFFQK